MSLSGLSTHCQLVFELDALRVTYELVKVNNSCFIQLEAKNVANYTTFRVRD